MFGDGDMSFSMAKSAKANKLVEFDCVRCGKHAEIQEGQKLRVVTPKDRWCGPAPTHRRRQAPDPCGRTLRLDADMPVLFPTCRHRH